MSRLISITGTFVVFLAAFGLLARYVSPEIFWPPAIVALLLPGLLILTLLFFLLQLLRRAWFSAAFAAVVLIFSFPVLGHLFASATPAPSISPDQPTLTLLTGNQRFFRDSGLHNADSNRIVNAFRSYAADIALLQEVRSDKYRQNFVEAIRESGQLRERHQKPNTYLATYAKSLKPIGEKFIEPNEYNGFLVTDLETDLGTIRLINAHLQTNKISAMTSGLGGNNSIVGSMETFGGMLRGYGNSTRYRARQAEDIRAIVDASPYPVILGGDFNDVPSSYTYNRVLSPRLRDAWSERGSGLGTTFTGPLPGLRIDFFMVDTSLTVLNIERLSSQWSDHRPLKMTVTRSH